MQTGIHVDSLLSQKKNSLFCKKSTSKLKLEREKRELSFEGGFPP
jgi:hypothetical protein